MQIAGIYSFKNGEEEVRKHFPELIIEVEQVIANIDAKKHKTKVSKEKTKKNKNALQPEIH